MVAVSIEDDDERVICYETVSTHPFIATMDFTLYA
jgi:hypothetical protein